MKNKANVLVEFSLGMWIWMLALAGFFYVAHLCLVKWSALEFARLGTELQAQTNLPEDSVRSLLFQEMGKRKFISPVDWSVDLRPPTSSPSFRFYNLVQTRITARLRGPFTVEEKVVSQKESHE